jgi:hypothetical protein
MWNSNLGSTENLQMRRFWIRALHIAIRSPVAARVAGGGRAQRARLQRRFHFGIS